jgi:glycosyltransferase involved in cell wall biosynthesis
VRLLVPPSDPADPSAVAVGRRGGQLWEQLELPNHTTDGLLLNLGNTAPLKLKHQVIVIHDAGVFSTPEAYPGRFKLWYRLMQRTMVLRKIPIVTVSEFARADIIRNLHARPDSVAVVPEGADHINKITADPTILERHGLTSGRFVLAVGNLAAHKNLAALGLLAQRLAGRGIPLVITGGFGGKAFHQRGGANLPQPAVYTGRVSDEQLKAFYQAAACFVFPSRYEGFGLPAAEAMACGCPVVASGIPALREVCGDAAIFCDPAAPAQFADAVLGLLDNPALSTRLAEAGLERTRTMTWANAAARLYDIIAPYSRTGA